MRTAKEPIGSLNQEIRDMENKIYDLRKAIEAKRKECKHIWIPSAETTDHSHPFCLVCEERGSGWWCPASPNHHCDYNRGEEGCKFCGEPDERK